MLKYLLEGGFIMIPLFFLSVLGLAVIIDRFRVFRTAEQVDADGLFRRVTEAIEQGEIDAAVESCRQSRGPIAAVLHVGLHKYRVLLGLKRSRGEIEENLSKTIGEYAPHVIELLEKRLNLLLMVGSVSPLLGMTGTVTGMITSFNSMSVGGVEGGAVAAGISEALITTAAGLIIAIPSVIFYNIFTKKVDAYALQIEEKASDMVEFIHLYGRNVQAP